MDYKYYCGGERDAINKGPRHPAAKVGDEENQKHESPNEFGQPGNAEDVAEEEKVANDKRNGDADASIRSPQGYCCSNAANQDTDV